MADVQVNLLSEDPKELLGLGLRAYYVHDYSNAVEALGKATQLMAKEHGDEHDSLGEVYVHYARALLELSREESSPLGDAIPQEESDSSPEEEEEGTEAEKETETDDNTDEGKDKEEESEKAEDEPEKTKTDGKVENGEDKEVPDKADEKKEDGSGAKDEKLDEKGAAKEVNGNAEPGCSSKPGEDDDCTDLQLAWEVLEVAKKIFESRGDAGKQLLADTLILLGDVAMESENFSDGVADMKRGLALQKELFDSTCRRLAETHYKIGSALTTTSNIDEAIENYNASLDILKNRVKKLRTDIEEKKAENENSAKEEIQEIEDLIPDVENKISDTKLMKDEAAQLLLEMTKTVKENVETVSPSKEVKDISHLVKRKRKPDDEPSAGELCQPTKKPTP